MKRSVIQLAGRTLLVSLPAKWADSNNVKKGDELDVIEDNHRLLINTEPKTTLETAELDADVLKASIKRFIFALYKKGIDEIKITYSDEAVADVIRDTLLNETVGYEIVSQTPKSCIVKLITSGNITEFDNLLRRTFLLLMSMSEEILISIKDKNYGQLLKTALLEGSNNRLTTVCRRSLNKWGNDTYKKIGPIYYIVEELEKLADEYKHLCKNLARAEKSGNIAIRPEALGFFERTHEELRAFYELFYKFNINSILTIDEKRTKFMEDAHRFLEFKKPNIAETYIIHHSIIIMQLIFGFTGPYLVLQR